MPNIQHSILNVQVKIVEMDYCLLNITWFIIISTSRGITAVMPVLPGTKAPLLRHPKRE
jgi:hypothetical protein